MNTSDNHALGDFLRARRQRLDPATFGFPPGRRRTPGLRREEVAQLASISPTWYTWLEQGRGGAPSREVLERVVEAFGDDVLETVIGRTVKFPDASVSGVPITEFAPEHAAAQAYLRLARELVARGAVA